jgi:hypothetical protein
MRDFGLTIMSDLSGIALLSILMQPLHLRSPISHQNLSGCFRHQPGEGQYRAGVA